MKKIKIKSKDLVENIKNVKEVNKKIQAVHKELVDADKRHKKLQFEVQRYKSKGVKILDKVLKEQYEMDEFDYSGEMDVIDDKIAEVTIHNFFDDNYGDLDKIKGKLSEDRKNKVGVWREPLMFTGHKDV